MKTLTRKVKPMTYRQKMDAIDLKLEIIQRRGNRCEYCGKMLENTALQFAHIVNKSRNNIEKYGAEAIHHPMNLKLTCSLCNSRAMKEVANSDHARNIHFVDIYKDLVEQGYDVEGE